VNSVVQIGNLTADPELRYIKDSGKALVTFTIAVNERYSDHTNFFDCQAWDKTADNIANHFKKGKAIGVTGRLKQERWENKEGQNRSKIIIVVEQFDFIGKKDE